jgi:2-desacetyl-2-hydroxyethyl bacteriochlorophyllide A dehydrogenase
MRAVRAVEGGVAVVDVDAPPGQGELLTMRAAGICGSDFGYIAGGSRFLLGHELVGVREDGTAVAVEALYGCMDCDLCRDGAYNLCLRQSETALGFSADGGMAEQFRAPSVRLVALPAGLDPADGSLVEPATVAWHGVRLGGTGPGRTVAVVGGGAIGQLAVAGAQAQGADAVALDARYERQREIGEQSGVGPPEGMYDVVIEAAGSPSALARAIELVAPGGSVVVLGVHIPDFSPDFLSIFLKEARIVPSIGYCRHSGGRDMTDAAGMLAERPDLVDALVTHRFPLEDAVEAFRVAEDRQSGALKVVIELG